MTRAALQASVNMPAVGDTLASEKTVSAEFMPKIYPYCILG